jgi:hypothetical protein
MELDSILIIPDEPYYKAIGRMIEFYKLNNKDIKNNKLNKQKKDASFPF